MIETRQILEELQLKNVLATSPTGAVFLAGDPETGDDVVIKMVSCAVPDAEEDVRRLFLSMVEAARSVEIQGMPALTDHGLSPEGDGFVVMKHVEGRTLDTVEELDAFASINILLDVLSCIEGLAAVGTAHLNLKPTNVFLTNSPAFDRAVVLGFGTSATLLHAGAGVPVPAHDPHLAPELVSGNLPPAEQRWRCDLFSFGVIACGVLGAEIEANGTDRPRVKIPAAVRSQLPEAEPLEDALGRIMAPDPMLRGSSPSDVRDPLIRALPEPPAAVRSTVPPAGPFDPNKTDPSIAPATPSTPPAARKPAPSPEETVAVAVDDGWPEVLFEDPEVPASVADSDDLEDTDITNPVPVDVWVPRGGEEAPEAVAAARAPAAASRGRRVTRLELIVVTAVVLVLASIIAITWPSGDEEAVVEVVPSAPVEVPRQSDSLVPPPPDDNPFDDLLSIQAKVDAGDLEGARAALDEFDSHDRVPLDSDASALYDSLVTAVAQAADRDAAIEDLRTGLETGSINMVRRGAAGLSSVPSEQIEETEGLSRDLERARKVLRLHGRMWGAHKEGDALGAIGFAGELERALPRYSGARDVREQAASALLARADAAAAERRFDDAVAILESLDRAWPGREGLDARLAEARRQADLARRDESVIAAALALGSAGDPEGGLAKLDALDDETRTGKEATNARSVLLETLARMDAGAPRVELATAEELGFKKNTTLTVPLRVSDDYRVVEVVVHARNATDDGFLRIPLEKAGDGLYHFRVTPELHGNKDVSFYVVATDRSGHTGHLGSAEAPLTVVRKRWFKKGG